jgi:Barstar (barnase inhibitor)
MDNTTPTESHKELPLKRVKSNIVQSIRAHEPQELQLAAQQLGHHFLYANLGAAQTKQDVLDDIASQFTLPAHFGKNFDALYDCMTDPLYKSGQQAGFIVNSYLIFFVMPLSTGMTAKSLSAAFIPSLLPVSREKPALVKTDKS